MNQIKDWLYCFVCAVLLLSLALPGQAAATDLTQQIAEKVNIYRSQAGVKPVTLNHLLSDTAVTIVKKALKEGALAKDPCDLVAARGYTWQICQFSMGGVAPEPDAVLNAWRKNMDLSHRSFTEIGIGIVKVQGQTVFGFFATKPMPKATFDRTVFLGGLMSFRKTHRKTPVSYNDRLDKAAQNWAKAHAKLQLVAVHRHGQSSLKSRLKAVSYRGRIAVENVGRFFALDSKAIVRKWANSTTGHRENMLEDDVEEIGVSCTHAPLRDTQDMGEYVCVLVLAAQLLDE